MQDPYECEECNADMINDSLEEFQWVCPFCSNHFDATPEDLDHDQDLDFS